MLRSFQLYTRGNCHTQIVTKEGGKNKTKQKLEGILECPQKAYREGERQEGRKEGRREEGKRGEMEGEREQETGSDLLLRSMVSW